MTEDDILINEFFGKLHFRIFQRIQVNYHISFNTPPNIRHLLYIMIIEK